jgi:hypothetical protein
MNEPIDSTQPIDIFFQKVDDCVQYAADGQVAYTTVQILQTAYHAVSTSGYYNNACKEWRKRPTENKTWENFKRFFAAEYHDLKEQQKVNTSNTDFHGANAAVEITTALDNLALAATNDRDIVMQLTNSNHQLTEANKLFTEQLQQAQNTNTKLVHKLSTQTQPTTDQTPKLGGRKPFNKEEWEAKLNLAGYCWTHEYRVTHGHDSKTCGGKLGVGRT